MKKVYNCEFCGRKVWKCYSEGQIIVREMTGENKSGMHDCHIDFSKTFPTKNEGGQDGKS